MWKDKLSEHRIRGCIAVSASGSHGQGSRKGSVFSQTLVGDIGVGNQRANAPKTSRIDRIPQYITHKLLLQTCEALTVRLPRTSWNLDPDLWNLDLRRNCTKSPRSGARYHA